MYGAIGEVFRDTRRVWRELFNYSIDLGAAKASVSHTEGVMKGTDFLLFVFLPVNFYHM